MAQGTQGNVDKAVLAYSGGLDTSVILKWLKEEYSCEVITFTADLGQVHTCKLLPLLHNAYLLMAIDVAVRFVLTTQPMSAEVAWQISCAHP